MPSLTLTQSQSQPNSNSKSNTTPTLTPALTVTLISTPTPNPKPNPTPNPAPTSPLPHVGSPLGAPQAAGGPRDPPGGVNGRNWVGAARGGPPDVRPPGGTGTTARSGTGPRGGRAREAPSPHAKVPRPQRSVLCGAGGGPGSPHGGSRGSGRSRSAMGNLPAVLPGAARSCGLCSRQLSPAPEEGSGPDKGSPVPPRHAEPTRFARLKNWETGSIAYDTLCAQAEQELPCSARRCLGSLVLPKQLPVPGTEGGRSGPELLALARDFIDQYYASIRR
ncbi:nitric oxide synthase, endothelial [Numida meleagris]|uniref:nitric oxide synthase, endothelial n=1 Tax=Numida meleagris TaxID=8996 RepID=UPI000B3E349C|nr:nitric oxide synthase, endothelial [Numida meleagris]